MCLNNLCANFCLFLLFMNPNDFNICQNFTTFSFFLTANTYLLILIVFLDIYKGYTLLRLVWVPAIS